MKVVAVVGCLLLAITLAAGSSSLSLLLYPPSLTKYLTHIIFLFFLFSPLLSFVFSSFSGDDAMHCSGSPNMHSVYDSPPQLVNTTKNGKLYWAGGFFFVVVVIVVCVVCVGVGVGGGGGGSDGEGGVEQ